LIKCIHKTILPIVVY